MASKRYAKIVVPLAVEGPFDYSIPPALMNKVKPGQRVGVSFRNKKRAGFVVGLANKSNVSGILEIEKIIDEKPLLDSHLLRLTRWVSKYYCCSWGEAIEAASPPLLKKRKPSLLKTDLSGENIKDIYNKENNFSKSPLLKPIRDSIENGTHKKFLLHELSSKKRIELYLVDSMTSLI